MPALRDLVARPTKRDADPPHALLRLVHFAWGRCAADDAIKRGNAGYVALLGYRGCGLVFAFHAACLSSDFEPRGN